MAFLTDPEIAALLAEPKPLPLDYRQRITLRPKRGHSERELDFNGGGGNGFRMILRQSLFNPLDFSVILAWLPADSTGLFRLTRFNGLSHEHTNTLEAETFYDFHIHRATERYQRAGHREDTYAEPTDRYQDFNTAIRRALESLAFQLPPGEQLGFFDEVDTL